MIVCGENRCEITERERENTKVCCEKYNHYGPRHYPVPTDVLLHQEPPFVAPFSAFLKDVPRLHAHHSAYLHTTGPPTALRFGSSHFSTHLVFYAPALGSSTLTALIPHLSPELCQKQSDPSLFG